MYNHQAQKVEYNYDIEHLIYTKPTSALRTGVSPLIDKNPYIISVAELYSDVEPLLPDINREYVCYTKPTSALTTGVSPLIGKNPYFISVEDLYSEEETFLPGVNRQYVLGVPSKIDSVENFHPIELTRLDTNTRRLPFNPENVIRTDPFDEDYI